MATKTISIDLEAYEMLRRARRTPVESFSKVIRRAQLPEDAQTAVAFLARCAEAPVIDDRTLVRLDEAQRSDAPPEDPWQNG
jgi:predicted CopG family antitoxin